MLLRMLMITMVFVMTGVCVPRPVTGRHSFYSMYLIYNGVVLTFLSDSPVYWQCIYNFSVHFSVLKIWLISLIVLQFKGQ